MEKLVWVISSDPSSNGINPFRAFIYTINSIDQQNVSSNGGYHLGMFSRKSRSERKNEKVWSSLVFRSKRGQLRHWYSRYSSRSLQDRILLNSFSGDTLKYVPLWDEILVYGVLVAVYLVPTPVIWVPVPVLTSREKKSLLLYFWSTEVRRSTVKY